MERKLKGMPVNYLEDLNDHAWVVARQRVANNPNLCIILDIETGFPEVVTLEVRDKIRQQWDALMPKVDSKFKGQLIVFGTGGGLDNNNSKDWWINNPC